MVTRKTTQRKPAQGPVAPTGAPRARTKAAPASSGYHHGNLRQALLDAGLAFLQHHPDEELSLRDLARTAGVTANAAYRHFTDKAALLRAIAAEGFRRFHLAQTQAQQGIADSGERFKASGLAYVGFALAHPALFRLMFSSPQIHHTDPELAEASAPAFVALLTAAAEQSGLALDDPHTLVNATQAWATVHGLSQLILDGRLQALTPSTDQLIDAVLDQMKFAPPAAPIKKTRRK